MTLAQSWSITTTAAHGRKAPTNNCTNYIGQNKSGKSADFCVTKPNFANMLPLLPSFALGTALLDQLLYGMFQAGRCVDTAEHHFWLTFDEGVTNLKSIKRI